jgi:signal transduction histidine kinase
VPKLNTYSSSVSYSLNVLELSNTRVLLEDGERRLCRASRLGNDGSRESVLVVLPAVDRPSRASLDRLTHEHELRDDLDPAWALRPLELVRERDRAVLLLEDNGGEPLELLLVLPLQVGHFLHLAITIAGTLSKIHRRGLIHKDIKPANIFVNRATWAIALTGFGIASRLTRERHTPALPEFIAGTLAYMAPEQTGRMNRSVDSRCDLYSLGVTLYQMLTGGLPFNASNPMEWVHCHVARQPAPPSKRLKDLAHMNRLTMLGELAASLAHEIKQPIAAARNNARAALNFLDKHPPDLGETREALDCIVGDADRAGNIIDRIRDQIKKAPPRKQYFDLNDAIREVTELARSAIIQNGATIRIRFAENEASIEGDRVQLQQVVLNLLLNAVEAMGSVEAGAREVSISTERSVTNDVLVTLRDSGPGIDPEDRERVFQAFYTTKSTGAGMG